MVTVVQPCKVSSPDLYHLSHLHIPSTSDASAAPSNTLITYKITNKSSSESSWLFFLEDVRSQERLVIKVLHDYKDDRYSLETAEKRQACQLEGLRQNSLFTPDAYLGLARICTLDIDNKRIKLDAILHESSEEQLAPESEYALVMRELPYDKRLDYLLDIASEDTIRHHYIQLLVDRVASIHQQLPPVASFYIDEEKVPWGSFQQLYDKLCYNLTFIDLIREKSKKSTCGFVYTLLKQLRNTVAHTITEKRQEKYLALIDSILTRSKNSQYVAHYERLDTVRRKFLQLVAQADYERYFEQRVQEQRIRHCHSDLKAANIWIAPNSQREDEEYVWILDAIDFNPVYSNIDILSDFATLVVDVQARTRSSSLAEDMIKRYMPLMAQEDKVSNLVLRYYLVEKAIIGAIVSLVYDHVPDLGIAFLDVVEVCLHVLQSELSGVSVSSAESKEQGLVHSR